MKQINKTVYILLAFVLSLGSLSSFADALIEALPIRPQEAPKPYDSYTGLAFRTQPIVNLMQFDARRFLYGESNFRPWNASYWPTYKGMLGHRYHDPHFPNSKTWATNRSYTMSANADVLLAQGRVDQLSPSEKYDLLVGDSQWTLTQAMWNKGVKPAERWGNVPGWFGICHGWAAATHMRVAEPENRVVAVNPSGVAITFFPNDIKALASYLWAESAPNSLFIGSKCRTVNPERDEWGRVVEQTCLDTNPMTLHVTLLNRIGRDGDSVVLDTSMHNEIWNYPIDSYSYRYFNLNTMKPARGLEDAILPIEKYHGDGFRAHRAEGTRYVVGVVMDVFFPAAVEPKAFGKLTKRLYKSKTFIYDLELDGGMNIIGGEWHSKDRPDFIWSYPFNVSAGSNQNVNDVSVWNYGQPIPADLAARAQQLSQRSKVLARIVNGLIERSVLSEDDQSGPVEEEQPIDQPGGSEDPGDQPGPETPGVGPSIP